MIVVDASAVVEVLLKSPDAAPIAARILDESESVHAPHLIDVEVVNVLRRCVASGEMEPDRARAAIDILIGLPISRYPHTMLLSRVWQLRHNLSAYDATYVVLTEVLRAPLLTCDRRLAAAAEHFAKVQLL